MDAARLPCHISHQRDPAPHPPRQWTPEEQWARWEAWERLVLAASIVALGAWLHQARGLIRRPLSRWLAVPLLLMAALACLLGPGHLFPKHPFEGPQLLRVSTTHALTALDLPGLAAGGAGVALGARAVWERLTGR